MIQKVLLLNPPGTEKYFRDNYCSPISKTGYYWQPTDLLVQSGFLGSMFDVHVLDAIIEERSAQEVLSVVTEHQFDAVLSLVGTASWDIDLELLETIRDILPNCVIAISGNIALFEYESVFSKYPSVDVALLDYTTDDFLKFLKGERDNILKLAYKENDRLVVKDSGLPKNISYPMPLHEKFANERYHLPLAIHHPSAIVITSAGCPHKCEFCVAAAIPYRFRPINDVVAELVALQKMGIKEVFFQDFMFDVKKSRTIELCAMLEQEGVNLSWYCSCRVDTLDREVLEAMKRAGCHTIQFGIESSAQEALDNQNKKTTKSKIRETIDLCNDVGIRVFGHFIIGLPGETEESMLNQGKYAREIGCHNAVFDTLVPDVGTPLREKAVMDGIISDELTVFSNSDKTFAVTLNGEDNRRMEHIRRKVMLDFYLHPKFLWNNFVRTITFYEFKQKVKFGLAVILNL